MCKLHPREEIVTEAEMSLRQFLVTLEKELTQGEYLRVITDVLSSEWSLTAKYTIRHERHPDNPDKPGGLE